MQAQPIIQISDLHFGAVVPELRDQLIETINRLEPQLLIVSGDITQRARMSQFTQARAFFDEIQCQARIIVPGNHDIAPVYKPIERFLLDPYRNYTQSLQGYIQTEYETSELKVIGVNSCNPMHYKNGHFTAEVLDEIEQGFASCQSSQLKFLVAHHPLDVIIESDFENLVPDSVAVVRRLAAIGVDLIMGGHIHYPFCRQLNARYLELANPVAVSQAGTAISKRTRSAMPNSFMVIRTLTQKEFTVEQWDFRRGDLEFRPVHSTHHP